MSTEVLYRESGEVLAQVGWDPGHPGLVPDLEVGGSACGRGVGT